MNKFIYKDVIYTAIITLLLPVIIASTSMQMYSVLSFTVSVVMTLLAMLYQSYQKGGKKLTKEEKLIEEVEELKARVEQLEKEKEKEKVIKDIIKYNGYKLLEFLTKA